MFSEETRRASVGTFRSPTTVTATTTGTPTPLHNTQFQSNNKKEEASPIVLYNGLKRHNGPKRNVSFTEALNELKKLSLEEQRQVGGNGPSKPPDCEDGSEIYLPMDAFKRREGHGWWDRHSEAITNAEEQTYEVMRPQNGDHSNDHCCSGCGKRRKIEYRQEVSDHHGTWERSRSFERCHVDGPSSITGLRGPETVNRRWSRTMTVPDEVQHYYANRATSASIASYRPTPHATNGRVQNPRPCCDVRPLRPMEQPNVPVTQMSAIVHRRELRQSPPLSNANPPSRKSLVTIADVHQVEHNEVFYTTTSGADDYAVVDDPPNIHSHHNELGCARKDQTILDELSLKMEKLLGSIDLQNKRIDSIHEIVDGRYDRKPKRKHSVSSTYRNANVIATDDDVYRKASDNADVGGKSADKKVKRNQLLSCIQRS